MVMSPGDWHRDIPLLRIVWWFWCEANPGEAAEPELTKETGQPVVFALELETARLFYAMRPRSPRLQPNIVTLNAFIAAGRKVLHDQMDINDCDGLEIWYDPA